MSRVRSNPESTRRVSLRMVCCTFLRRERQCERRWSPQCERQSLLERQRLECQVSQPLRDPATYCFSRPLCGESFVSNPFFQPPSICPISSSASERTLYFLISISPFSQPICRKNFSRSSFPIATTRYCDLTAVFAYWAWKRISKVFKKSSSIFPPKV